MGRASGGDRGYTYPANRNERAFYELAKQAGWRPVKSGWPDFICFGRDGGLILVEVKAHAGDRLRDDQTETMVALGKYGVLVYRWDPVDGLRPILPDGSVGERVVAAEER